MQAERVPGAPRAPQAASIAAKPVLQVRNLRAGYGDKEILRDVSFTLNDDDFFAIIGPSGAGKSTLIRCVNRLVDPKGGEVIFDSVDLVKAPQKSLRNLRRNIGMIFQEFNLIERMSVMDNVLSGRLGDVRAVA